jgi:hypothetical protein
MLHNTHVLLTAKPFCRVLTLIAIALGLYVTSAHAGPAFSEFVDPNPSAGNGFAAMWRLPP